MVRADAVVDDLAILEIDVSIKDLFGTGVVFCTPVVDCSISDEAKGSGRDPFPKSDVCIAQVALDFLLCVEVEDLELFSGLESENLLERVHDSRVCGDGSAHDGWRRVIETNDGDTVLTIVGFPDTDVLLALHGTRREADGIWVDTQCCQHDVLIEDDGRVGHGDE